MVKIKGVFTSWSIGEVTKTPEVVFRMRLERNPTHPFVQLDDDKLILRWRSTEISTGFLLLIGAALFAYAVYYAQGSTSLSGGGTSIYSIPLLIAIWGLVKIFFNFQVKT